MQQEKTMKKTTRIATAFIALAGLAATATYAADRDGWNDHSRHMRFEKADADSCGDVTFDEFAAAMNARFANADADKDGKMTVGEIASEIERMRAERQAERLIRRFDADGDGALTAAEIEGRQKKLFALMDRNDDGKIAKDEMGRRGSWRHGDREHD